MQLQNQNRKTLSFQYIPGMQVEGPGNEPLSPASPRAGRHRVVVRTFGHFDVFVDGRPILFRSEKARELLAILVDRRGGFVTSDEAISLLWEGEPAGPRVLSRYRKVSLRLKNQLEEYDIPGLVESVRGKRRFVPEQADVDLYQFLSGGPEYASLFHGSYLNNYSWGEITLGELTGISEALQQSRSS